jgi:hypothetical protein
MRGLQSILNRPENQPGLEILAEIHNIHINTLVEEKNYAH